MESDSRPSGGGAGGLLCDGLLRRTGKTQKRQEIQRQKAVKGTEGAGTAESGSSQSAETETRDSVVVVMGPTSEPEAGFDPAYGWGAGEHVHEPLIQSTLTVTTPDLKIGYDLAEDVQASEDGLTWQVKIRDDVRFTDGEPLTAEDVAFTYNTLKDTSSVNDFTMLKEAVAVDDTTVEFHMNRPYPSGLIPWPSQGSCRNTPMARITDRSPLAPDDIF